MAKPAILVTTVKWMMPRNGCVKLNLDGRSRGNPTSSGGGGIVRDSEAKMLIAYAIPFRNNSNNTFEAIALLAGIEWCSTNEIKNIEIESDS